MTLDLLYFAWVRERIGTDAERVELPLEVRDVRGLIAWLEGRGAGHAQAFVDPDRLRAAADGRFVSHDFELAGTRELALFPPVTGG